MLWERVEAGDERAEQRHGEMLRIHTELQRNGKSGKLWLSRLVERQLAQLRRRMDDNRQQREQVFFFQLLVVGYVGALQGPCFDTRRKKKQGFWYLLIVTYKQVFSVLVVIETTCLD